MQRILVTGGAGLIGSHLCKKLLEDNNEVICLDNLYTGKKDNIKQLLDDKNFDFIRHDVTNEIQLEVDQIYNLACPASPIHYQRNPVKTINTSVLGAINTLNLAKEKGARILQASTSEVYGDPIMHPQKEEYWGNVNPIGIRSCYDEGKRVAETLFFDYHRQYNVEIKVARIFNTYGTNMAENDGRVISNFIMQALKNEDITIYGNGRQTRSFCYVDDMVAGLIKLMNSNKTITGPINLGNPSEITMVELAKKIIDMTNSTSKIVFKPLPEDDPVRRNPDISKAENLLDWHPTTMLDKGLKYTIKYFDKIIKKSNTK